MKKWIVKFASLLVFNIAVLLIIGWLTPARVGWAALWAGVILTAATIWIKPVLTKMFTSMTSKSAGQRTKAGEKTVEFVLVFVVAVIVWVLTVWLSGVSAGNFWGYVLPPLILLLGWVIYDAIDDKVEGQAGQLYDKATGAPSVDAAVAAPPSPATEAAQAELKDGLTAEQRKMLDDLG